jgi:hypothetical protein
MKIREMDRLAIGIHLTSNFRLLRPIYHNGRTERFAKLPYIPERKRQGETLGIFTLMILEIANQIVKISSTLKTCDMSRIFQPIVAIAPLFRISTCHNLAPIRQPPLLGTAELSQCGT